MKALEKVIASESHSEAILKEKGLSPKGTYILLIEIAEDQTIRIGSLRTLCFLRGYYAYVGSAMSGFKSRLSHHLRENKKPRWHIDYLLQKASIGSIMLCETEDRAECRIAQALRHRFDSVPDFGSSDCRCSSHLFFTTDEEQMKSEIMTILNVLGYRARLIY